MVKMRRKFIKLQSEKPRVKRFPLLKLPTNRCWFLSFPYIDSGADVTLIPLSMGRLLGWEVDESKIQQIGGIRGSIPVIYIKNQMKIGEEEFSTQIAWSLIEDVPPLLGRKDVFDIFRVIFEQYNKFIIFEKRL